MNERDVLTEMGLTEAEIVVCRLAAGIWRLVDFDGALWRSAGKKLYGRFEDRIRFSANQPDVLRWAWRCATKCHVSPQLLDKELIGEARRLTPEQTAEALRTLRRDTGLVVSAVRALGDLRKTTRKEMEAHGKKHDPANQQASSAGVHGTGTCEPLFG